MRQIQFLYRHRDRSVRECQILGVNDLGHQLVVVGSIRPSKVTANAFNAGFVRREALLF